MDIILEKSKRKNKKWMVKVNNETIHFGDDRYEDYTQHGNKMRRSLYTTRHKKNEDWTKKGINTAGFWSRWLTWEKPTIKGSIKNIEDKFNVTILML